MDQYEFFKNAYLQQRLYLVYDGNVPEEEDGFEIDEEFDKDNLGPINPY
jgi:phospholipid-binding lipoprotein MlaA